MPSKTDGQTIGMESGMQSSSTRSSEERRHAVAAGAAFELLVLGSGGGPLETDCSGFVARQLRKNGIDGLQISLQTRVRPVGRRHRRARRRLAVSQQEQTLIATGSGLGALATLLERHSPSILFPSLSFPDSHHTPVLQAAYIFSFLSSAQFHYLTLAGVEGPIIGAT